MSADNGIYILETKDQYRVIHAQAIENLCWSFLSDSLEDEIVPTRIVEYYGMSRYTRNGDIARRVAFAMAKDCPVLEYGIKTITIDKTWRQIVQEAKQLAPLEIEVIKNKVNSKTYKYDLLRLEKVLLL